MDKEVIIALISTVGGGTLALLGQAIKAHYDSKKVTAEVPQAPPAPSLLSHPLFRELDECEMYFMTRFSLPDPGRTILLRELVIKKVRIWRKYLEDNASKLDTCIGSCESSSGCVNVYNIFKDVYNAAMIEYVTWHKQPIVTDYTGTLVYDATSVATMDKCMELFKIEHAAAEQIVAIAIDAIGNSTMYNFCHEQSWDTFTIYQFAFIQFRLSAERVLKTLNGSLTGSEFLGITIGGC